MSAIKQQLNALVGEALAKVSHLDDCNAHVITAAKPEFGDYQANGVMAVASRLRTSPVQLAQRVVDELNSQQIPLVGKLEVAGPGFINIHLSRRFLLEAANHALANPNLGLENGTLGQTIAVDYSSPNLAKEMHVGHLRGTIIGDCLVRVLEKLGHRVIRQNHVGDWGTQFGMLITHLRELEKNGTGTASKLEDLEVFYRDARQRFDGDPAFAEESRRSVVRLQRGETAYLSAWQRFIDASLQHCEAVYDRLAVTLRREDLDAESRYNDDLPKVVADLESAGLLTESDGAGCVFLEQFKGKDGQLLPLIVQKSDGGYLYSTTDLAAVRWRMQQGVERALYVVDARQSLHFQQVFAVARAAGFADRRSLSLEHIAYGTIMGKDGRPFRTRSGDSIKLVDLLDESVKRAGALVAAKNPDLSPEEKSMVARRVGIAAVKYADLSKNRTSDYVFDWDQMLSLEGNTAPYMLYAYARIRSILRKAPPVADPKIAGLQETAEWALVIKLLQLPEVLLAVARDCYPNQLCSYLYDLAGQFMRFYEACPVLQADTATRQSRLALVQLTARTLHQGLDLLGIETLEKM